MKDHLPKRAKPAAPASHRHSVAHITHRMQWNENPFDYPADLKEEVLHRLTGVAWARYPTGLQPYALIDKLAELTGVPADGIVIGNGSSSLIKTAMVALLRAGDHMAMPSPTFLLYRRNAGLIGAHVHETPCSPDDDFALPVDDLIVNARTNEAKLIALCAPNNPTGTIFPLDALRRVADESGAVVFIDEAYAEFCGQELYPLVNEFDNVILLRTFSKAYGMAGVRVGYALTTPALADELNKHNVSFPVSTFSELTALVALEHRDRFQVNMRRVIAERERMAAGLGAMPGVRVFPSGANFLLIHLERPVQPLLQHLREAYDIVVNDMDAYPELPSYVRVSIGAPDENDLFLQGLQEYVGRGP